MWLRRVGILLALCGLAVVAALIVRARGAARSNVILVCVDTLRADHIHAAGYARDTTPHLDALIRRSVYFRHAYSQYTSTWLSVGSFFSSLYPHDFINWSRRSELRAPDPPTFIVPPQFPVMPEYFRRHGYYTAAVVANPHLQPQFGFARGFDELHVLPPDLRDPERLTYYARAAAVNEMTVRRYRAVLRAKRPFFLYLHYMDPHVPYLPLPPFKGRYAKGLPRSDRLDWKNMPARLDYDFYRTLTEADAAYMMARYDEEIRGFDEEFGNLLATLEEEGALDNTVLVLTADHGEEFLEHGYYGHGNACQAEAVHVPLLIHGPRFKPRMVDRPVGLISLWPTLAELIEPDPDALRRTKGVSLLPELEGRRRPKQSRADAAPEVISEGNGSLSLRTEAHSYVLYFDPGALFPVAASRPGSINPPEIWHRLYRMDRDPGEERDRFASERDTAARLNARLAATCEEAVSNDYWLGDDALAAWFGGGRADLARALSVATEGPATKAVLQRPDGAGHFTLRAANSAGEPGSLNLRVKTRPDSLYYFAMVYVAVPPQAPQLAVREGGETVLEEGAETEDVAARLPEGARAWIRTLPTSRGEATLSITVPPHSALRVDELHALPVHFLVPRRAEGRRGLDKDYRERLRGLGYVE